MKPYILRGIGGGVRSQFLNDYINLGQLLFRKAERRGILMHSAPRRAHLRLVRNLYGKNLSHNKKVKIKNVKGKSEDTPIRRESDKRIKAVSFVHTFSFLIFTLPSPR
jgi:hypothetical protein